MPDPDAPVISGIALGPRLSRLVGTSPDTASDHVQLRPALPGVPAVEDQLPELALPPARRGEGADAPPDEPGLSHTRPAEKERTETPETDAETPRPVRTTPDADPAPDRGNDTPPDSQRGPSPPVEKGPDRTQPRAPVLRPAPLIKRIPAQPSDSPPTADEPQRFAAPDPPATAPAPASIPDPPPEPLIVPAQERIVERIIQPSTRNDRPRPAKARNAPERARQMPIVTPPAPPDAEEFAAAAERPDQAADTPRPPGSPPLGTPPKPPDQTGPRPDPMQPGERIEPLPPMPRAAEHRGTKSPVRVEIGALNITLRPPDPPRARPKLHVARKAPRAHSIPLRGFGED